ncbi:MAG TPA: hypothetical protein VK824_10885 [Planctomycetota bacterium]|nr:hypothetical protein [Planctomycetota bacterium]
MNAATRSGFTVALRHGKNPDIAGGYWTPPVDSGKTQHVPAATLAAASIAVRAYITRNGLGGGNFPSATVTDARGRNVATISFNGRVWPVAPATVFDVSVTEPRSDHSRDMARGWYFHTGTDEDVGAIGPFETRDEATAALVDALVAEDGAA